MMRVVNYNLKETSLTSDAFINLQNKNVSVICQSDVAEQHSEIPGIGDARTAGNAKEAVAMAAEAAQDPDNNLVMCGVRLQGSDSAHLLRITIVIHGCGVSQVV